MRSTTPFSGFSRWLFMLLLMMACGGAVTAQVTTITGTVFAPNGTDPLPNILVFVVPSQLPPFTAFTGPQSCTAQAALVPQNLGYATTDYKGNFTLVSSAITTSTVNVVIEAGKWRRQYPNTTVTIGGTTPVGNLAMPNGAAQGDLPNIAIVTGSADAIECVLGTMGILASEVTDVSNPAGHINLFVGSPDGGAKATTSSTSTEAQLMGTSGSPALINNYDMVMFGCQGTPNDSVATNTTALDNLNYYTAIGGRVFATHYGYVWLDKPETYETAAVWPENDFTPNNGTGTITVDTSYPEGVTLANWLQYIGASPAGAAGYGQITGVQNLRQDQHGVIAPTQSWGTLNPPYASGTFGTPVMQFSFNTPLGMSGTPTVAISFTNNSTSFLQGDAADSVTINVTNNSTTPTGSGLIMTIGLPGGLTATSLVGENANSGWSCNVSTLICTNSGIAVGASDPVLVTFSVGATTQVGQSSLTAVLSGGNLSGTDQCGRVLFNEYHVENFSGAGKVYPNECTNATSSPAEKFLEFSLYNLSNFIAPSTTDVIEIQGPTQVVWTQPTSIPYGTALSSTQLAATTDDPNTGITVPGTCVYAPPAGTVPNVPGVTVSVNCTPADATDYLSSSTTENIQVTPDSTTTSLTNVVTPIFYGQIIDDAAIETVSSNGPAASVDGGVMNFYIDNVLVCPLPAIAGGVCPPPTGQGYDAGTHNTYSAYAETPPDQNFLPSSSAVYPVVVQPDPTTTAIATSANPSIPAQAVTFTATVGDQYATAVGTANFYDGTALIGSTTLNAQGVATLTLTNLLVGAHNITVCFVSALNSVGTVNFLGSCSASVLQLVTFPPTLTPTVTTLLSSDNPSVVGQSVTFSTTVSTTGAFVAIPTGTVTFLDGTSTISTATLDATGSATLTTSSLTAGLHNISVAYAGATNLAASTSPVVAQQVNTALNSAATDFILTVTPTTISVGAGSSIVVNVTVTELNNFNTPIQLSCSGLPTEAACSFATSLISAEGGTTSLVISPAAPHNCGSSTPYFVAQGRRTGIPLLAFGALLFLVRRRRALKGIVLAAAALCLLPMLSGCGGNCTDLATEPGTYTFLVTGTSTAPVTVVTGSGSTSQVVTHSQTMTMTVTI